MRKVHRSWRTVRVFISSTFKDMHAERDQLVKVVFPSLRERLQAHRVHLVDVDLRWGVTQEQSDNDLATELCLQQVDACRPFFLGILGQRYGYVPESPTGPTVSRVQEFLDISGRSVTELEIAAALHGESGRDVQAVFFLRDPTFIGEVPMAKRAEVEAESPEAERSLARLEASIRRRSSAGAGIEEYSCSYRGLRVNPHLGRELDASARKVFESVAQDGVVDPGEYERLDGALREFVHRHGVVYTGDLEDLGRRVQRRLWDTIRQELELPDTPLPEAVRDPVAEEEELHDRFMESRLRFYVERKRVQGRLLDDLEDEASDPLVVTGPSGAGKSALMAWLVQTLEERVRTGASPDGSVIRLVVPHFVGASPASTSLRRMLRRLCRALRDEFASDGRAAAGEQPPAEVAGRPHEQTDELVHELRALAQRIPQNGHVVLVIDALDQLDGTDNAHAMHWLPRSLPANLRVIMSCSAERKVANESAPRPPGISATASLVLAAFRHRPHRRIDVPVLADEELLEIIRDVPSISAKTLDAGQRSLLVQNLATRNPLFLLVALEELRGFGSFEQLEARIARFPRDGDTLTEIFQQVTERLAEEFGRDLVRRALSSLACSRFGLSERELEEIAVSVERPDGDSGILAAGLYAVLRQIRSYTQHRAELLDFFHRNFREAVHQRYLATTKAWREGNAGLAEYFRAKADPDGEGSWSGGYARGLSELPYHLTQAEEAEALRGVLTDFAFLQAKIVEFGPQAVIKDFDLALDSGAMAGLEEATTLRLVRDALRLSVHPLASDPSQLLTQIWGRLIFEEAPSVRPLLDSFAAKADRPWLRLWTPSLTRPRPVLWQADLTNTRPDQGHPRIALTPDGAQIVVASGDGSLLVFSANSAIPMIVLEGNAKGGEVLDAVVTDDGRKVRTLRGDGSVDVWDLVDQALESTGECIELASLGGTAHALASDGNLLIIGTEAGSIELRRLDEPDSRQRLESHEADVCAVAAAPAGSRAAAAYADGEVRIWNLEDGRALRPATSSGEEGLTIASESWQEYGASPPNALALSGNGETLFAGNALEIHSNIHASAFATQDLRGMLIQWDLRTGDNTFSVEAYSDGPVCDLDVSFDGRFGVTLSERGKLKLWDLTTVERASRLDQHLESAPIVAVAPDGRRVLSTADDGMLLVWDLTTGEVETLRGHRDPAFDLRVSTNGRYAIVVSAGHCQVWDLERSVMGSILGELTPSDDFGVPAVWMRTVVPLEPGDRALSVASDGTVTTWNLKSGEPESDPVQLPDAVHTATVAGRWLLYAPDSDSLVLWDLERMIPHARHRFEDAGLGVKLFPVSDDGRFYIERAYGSAYLWDSDRAAPKLLPEAESWGEAVAMQVGGDFALFCRGERTLSLRSWHTHNQVAAYTAEAGLSSVALSPDGRLVAAGDAAKRVHILLLEVPEAVRPGGG